MKWKVIRQELLIFHARHKRMRFIFEQDNHEDAHRDNADQAFERYRHHAQTILSGLRGIFKDLKKGCEVSLIKNQESSDASNEGNSQGIDSGDKIEIKFPKNIDAVKLSTFLDYWKGCLKFEGWDENSAPIEFITKVEENTIENGGIKERQEPISYNELTCIKDLKNCTEKKQATHNMLVNLLSTLPILPHWDISGISSEDSQKNQRESNKSHEKSSSILSSLAELRDSTFYGVHLTIHKDSESENNNSDSKSLLGYQADLRLFVSDADPKTSKAPFFTAEEDYFAFCHYPNDAERRVYQIYGVLIDALIKAISYASSNFYISYPITTTLGRQHFWNIWLSPEKEDATLEDLWSSWWPLHQRFLNWSQLHATLAAELERLDHAFFQEAIQQKIKAAFSNNADSVNCDKPKEGDDKQYLNQLICEHANMLFPADCVCDNSGNVWGYEKYMWPEKDPLIQIGHEWKAIDKKDTYSENTKARNQGYPQGMYDNLNCANCISYKVREDTATVDKMPILFHGKFTTGELGKLQYHRCENLLEQQQHQAETIFMAYLHDTREKNMKKRQCQEQLRKTLLNKSRDAVWRTASLDALEKDSWENEELLADNTTLKDPFKNGDDGVLKTAKAISDFLFGTGDAAKNLLKTLISGGLHLFVSEILETGPVKRLSHGRYEERKEYCKNYPDGITGLAAYFNAIKEKVTSSLTHNVELKKLRQEVKNIVDSFPISITVDNLISISKELDNLKNKRNEFNMYFTEEILKENFQFIDIVEDCETRYGAYRASLPLKYIFKKGKTEKRKTEKGETEKLIDNMRHLNDNKMIKFSHFSLPLPGQDATKYELIYINCLVLLFQKAPDSISHHMESISSIDEHFKSFGGDFYFVTKNGNNWIWQQAGNAGSTQAVSEERQPISGSDNIYQYIFNQNTSFVCLFTHLGYYSEDISGVTS